MWTNCDTLNENLILLRGGWLMTLHSQQLNRIACLASGMTRRGTRSLCFAFWDKYDGPQEQKQHEREPAGSATLKKDTYDRGGMPYRSGHWSSGASLPLLLPLGRHCPFGPSCWRRLFVFVGLLCQTPHRTKPGPPGPAVRGSAPQEV